MKTSYRQYNSSLDWIAKKLGGNYALAESNWRMLCAEDIRSGKLNTMVEVYVMEMELELHKKSGVIHLFIKDESFLDWILSCTPTTGDGCAQVLQETIGNRPGILHFPSNSKYITTLFKVPKEGFTIKEDGSTADAKDYGAVVMSFASHPKRTVANGMAMLSGNNNGISKQTSDHARLICGLGMYLSCFPEMLKDGPPDDVKHQSHHQYDTIKTIGISPKIRVHSEHGEVTPHFRRGHFRVLRSEQFTKKRFQVVFVKQCFVKGEAATILSPEQGAIAA